MSDSLRLHGLQPTRLLRPWDLPGKSTGVVCHCLLRKLQHFHNKGAMMPVAEAVHFPASLAPPGSPQAKQLRHLHTRLSLGQSCHRQKKSCIYAHRVTSVMSNSLLPCRLWPARLLCQGAGLPRQEHWSVLANIGCHTLLEHCISCCPSHQLP